MSIPSLSAVTPYPGPWTALPLPLPVPSPSPQTQFVHPPPPLSKNDSPKPIGALLGGTLPSPSPFPYPTPCHLVLLVQLLVHGQPPISISALVDSGGSESFLDPSILSQHHLHPFPHPQPIPLELIDGNTPSTGPITHYFPTSLRVHGTHTKNLTF